MLIFGDILAVREVSGIFCVFGKGVASRERGNIEYPTKPESQRNFFKSGGWLGEMLVSRREKNEPP